MSFLAFAMQPWKAVAVLVLALNPSDMLQISAQTANYPPLGLSAANSTLSGLIYGNGTYSVSSAVAGSTPWSAFDKTTSTAWSSLSANYQTVHGYKGTASTTLANGSVILGDWLQINYPYCVEAQSFSIASSSNSVRPPTKFSLFGTNSSSWALLLSVPTETSWNSTTTKTLNYNLPSNASCLQSFRLIVSEASMGSGALTINEMNIVGSNGNLMYLYPTQG
jgi:hypothetical protein